MLKKEKSESLHNEVVNKNTYPDGFIQPLGTNCSTAEAIVRFYPKVEKMSGMHT